MTMTTTHQQHDTTMTRHKYDPTWPDQAMWPPQLRNDDKTITWHDHDKQDTTMTMTWPWNNHDTTTTQGKTMTQPNHDTTRPQHDNNMTHCDTRGHNVNKTMSLPWQNNDMAWNPDLPWMVCVHCFEGQLLLCPLRQLKGSFIHTKSKVINS